MDEVGDAYNQNYLAQGTIVQKLDAFPSNLPLESYAKLKYDYNYLRFAILLSFLEACLYFHVIFQWN